MITCSLTAAPPEEVPHVRTNEAVVWQGAEWCAVILYKSWLYVWSLVLVISCGGRSTEHTNNDYLDYLDSQEHYKECMQYQEP